MGVRYEGLGGEGGTRLRGWGSEAGEGLLRGPGGVGIL